MMKTEMTVVAYGDLTALPKYQQIKDELARSNA